MRQRVGMATKQSRFKRNSKGHCDVITFPSSDASFGRWCQELHRVRNIVRYVLVSLLQHKKALEHEYHSSAALKSRRLMKAVNLRDRLVTRQ